MLYKYHLSSATTTNCCTFFRDRAVNDLGAVWGTGDERAREEDCSRIRRRLERASLDYLDAIRAVLGALDQGYAVVILDRNDVLLFEDVQILDPHSIVAPLKHGQEPREPQDGNNVILFQP